MNGRVGCWFGPGAAVPPALVWLGLAWLGLLGLAWLAWLGLAGPDGPCRLLGSGARWAPCSTPLYTGYGQISLT